MKTCQQCGKSFDPVNERPSHPAMYCSRSCSHAAQRTKVTLVCRQCGQSFQRKAYMVDWSQERGPFCGFRCYGRWQSEHMTGPANPTYNPDSTKRDAWNWQQSRQAALARDGQCVDCGSTRRLHVHHLGDPDNHALDNLATLCISCHRKRHPVPHGLDGRFVSIR